MNILGIGNNVLSGIAYNARQAYAPELGTIHVQVFHQPQNADVYRAVLHVVAGDGHPNGNMIVWQNVDVRPEEVANVRDEALFGFS